MKQYLYGLLRKYVSLFVRQDDSIVEIDPTSDMIIQGFPKGSAAFRDSASDNHAKWPQGLVAFSSIPDVDPDFLLLGGAVHYERDIQSLFRELHRVSRGHTRLIITYYSSVWRPLMRVATWLGLRTKTPELNWLANEDIENLLALESFEMVRRDYRVLIPFRIPLISDFVNRYLAPLPVFSLFCLLNVVVARPLGKTIPGTLQSVSVIVPARNEAGNIEAIVARLPALGPDDELIFVEGNSSDRTWDVIQDVQRRYRGMRRITIAQQDGEGKGNAVRKGFSLARNEILIILDADMTVPPEDLVNFYRAITTDKAEFLNGSRLIYPMEENAMRFLNLVANKFFAVAFSFVLGQRFKDTLCGTKVISKSNYCRLVHHRSYFGEFDPFGDFDLIFGAARMCLKTIEVPVSYAQRTYGDTNISRWKHGFILFAMLMFAARKIKFI